MASAVGKNDLESIAVDTGNADLSKYGSEEASLEDRIKSAIASSAVVLFGKPHCPFCIEVRNTFAQLNVKFLNFCVDTDPNGPDVWAALKKLYNHQTVPYVCINGKFIGGCDSTKALQSSGELERMMKVAGYAAPATGSAGIALSALVLGTRRPGGTLFHFPDVIDNRMQRLGSLWTVIICVLVAAFWKRRAAHWVMVILMGDYALRVMGGGSFCALGALTYAIIGVAEYFGSKPRFVPGPPKQFAAFCGLMFATLASFFFLVAEHEQKLKIVGLSFTCALAVAALLEWALNFCLGCWMFSLGVQFGLIPEDIYTTATNSLAEYEYSYDEANKRLNEGVAPSHVKHFDEQVHVMVDYAYKAKTEDMTKEDFHFIKHVKISHFVMHLGFIGLACVWKAADPARVGLDTPACIWYILGIASAITYFSWVVLYLAKMVLYPRKVYKEWCHNVEGNAFVLPFICLVLFAFIEAERDRTFAKVLFWIGAPTSLAISLVRVGDWIASKKEIEHINAAWMIMPVGNFVAAMTGPLLDQQYRDAMQAWFAFAFIMWAALFVITLFKAITFPDYDDRVRPALAIWVAAPAVGAVAYLSCFYPNALAVAGATGVFNDFIFINLHWMGVMLTLVLSWCFVRPYFGRSRFEMSYWMGAFPADAMAICSIYYYVLKPGGLSAAIAYAFVFIASYMTAGLLLHTAAAIIRRRVFVPDYKWGPLSFMRLTHEALRGAAPKLVAAAKDAAEQKSEAASESFMAHWKGFLMAFLEHSTHEDSCIFPVYEEFFPEVAAGADAQHHALDAMVTKLREALGSAKSAGDVAGLADTIQQLAADLEAHLRHEEDHLQGMPRKYIPLAMSKDIVRKCWSATPATTWYVLLPWIVNNLPMITQRVRFIKTILWAMPERAQQLGLMLATGVSPVQWRRLTEELPELVPRGAPGWERYY